VIQYCTVSDLPDRVTDAQSEGPVSDTTQKPDRYSPSICIVLLDIEIRFVVEQLVANLGLEPQSALVRIFNRGLLENLRIYGTDRACLDEIDVRSEQFEVLHGYDKGSQHFSPPKSPLRRQ